MRSVFHLAIRLYLVLVVVTCVPTGAGGAVLCVVPNGHMAIEQGPGRCADNSTSATGEDETKGCRNVADGCSGCVDVPVRSQVLSTAHRLGSTSVPQSFALSPMVAGSLDAEFLSASIRSAAMCGNRPLPAFPPSRTTILRN